MTAMTMPTAPIHLAPIGVPAMKGTEVQAGRATVSQLVLVPAGVTHTACLLTVAYCIFKVN